MNFDQQVATWLNTGSDFQFSSGTLSWGRGGEDGPTRERGTEGKEVIGAVGLVPSLMPFGLLPYYHEWIKPAQAGLSFPEVGLFWALGQEFRGQGYATEAAQALIDYAFGELRLVRIVATTEYSNLASQGVMRRLGMRVEQNPFPQPEYMQVVGIIENPGG
jgi:[ribosomal protein S5]-alanine N-acetyltransferase